MHLPVKSVTPHVCLPRPFSSFLQQQRKKAAREGRDFDGDDIPASSEEEDNGALVALDETPADDVLEDAPTVRPDHLRARTR